MEYKNNFTLYTGRRGRRPLQSRNLICANNGSRTAPMPRPLGEVASSDDGEGIFSPLTRSRGSSPEGRAFKRCTKEGCSNNVSRSRFGGDTSSAAIVRNKISHCGPLDVFEENSTVACNMLPRWRRLITKYVFVCVYVFCCRTSFGLLCTAPNTKLIKRLLQWEKVD